jgi:hypothetical protein
MGYRSVLAAGLAALVLAACGSSSSSSDQASGPRNWPIQRFLRLSGLQRSSDGLSYTLPNHPQCVARILLRSNAEVQTYTNAGDVVATNPDKSAGVRVEPGEPASCKAVFTQALAKLR